MRFLFIILLLPFFGQAQTRLYFPVSDAAAISTAYHSGQWGYTTEAATFKLNNTKGSSAITTGTQIGAWTTGQNALDRQYISTRMNAGIVFSSATTTLSMQLMVREYATADNAYRIILSARIVSEDGATQRVVLRVGNINSSDEFINNATHRNLGSGGVLALSGSYTTVLGDRLVIEIGYTDLSGTTPEASAKWGENATDLPVNNTQTTDGAGWIEFSNTITFAGETGPTRRVTIIQ